MAPDPVRPSVMATTADLMRQHGWEISQQEGAGELRLEGARRGGAAVMVTAKHSDTKGWRVRYYVIGAQSDGWTQWARVHGRALEPFIATETLDSADVRRWLGTSSNCRCRKVHEATQWRASRRLVGTQLNRLATRGAEEEKRVYRCPNDARRWHMTSRTDARPAEWTGSSLSL